MSYSSPRHKKAADLLRMALWASSEADGVTIEDAMEEFSVSRRTAERMREALEELFQVRDVDDCGRKRRWRVEAWRIAHLPKPDPELFSNLEKAAKLLTQADDEAGANRIRGLSQRLKSGLQPHLRNRLAPDIEALVEAEGFALRPGPKETIKKGVVESLRGALLQGTLIETDHRSRASSKLSRNQRLGVLGFLYGPTRRYLVAWSEYADAVRLYALSGFDDVRLLNEPFQPPEDFDLSAYLAGSFGVFQDELVCVRWRFAPGAAEEAATYRFHPTQQQYWQRDGSLIVEFTACGLDEMCWHLFLWGDQVEVLAPLELQERYDELLRAASVSQNVYIREGNLGGY